MSVTRLALAAALLLGQVFANSEVSSLAANRQAYTHTVHCETKLALTSVELVPTTTITRRIHDPSSLVVLTTI